MYLFILENGETFQTTEVSEQDLTEVENGYISLFSVNSEGKFIQLNRNGYWEQVAIYV
jgi:hypothetical protein